MQKWNLAQAQDELIYIKSINPVAPPSEHNCDRATFAEYCNMQANSLAVAGFHLIALEITQARDIAKPNYRSSKRNEGHETFNEFSLPYGLYNEHRGTTFTKYEGLS